MFRVLALSVSLFLSLQTANAGDLEKESRFTLGEVTDITEIPSTSVGKPKEMYEVKFKKHSFQTLSKIELVRMSHPAAGGQDFVVLVILETTGKPVTTDLATEVTEKITVDALGTPHRFFGLNSEI